MAVYEIHGIMVNRKGAKADTFRVEIVSAADDAEARVMAGEKKARLRPWGRLFKLYRVPHYPDGTRLWRPDEMTFVADLDLEALD